MGGRRGNPAGARVCPGRPPGPLHMLVLPPWVGLSVSLSLGLPACKNEDHHENQADLRKT